MSAQSAFVTAQAKFGFSRWIAGVVLAALIGLNFYMTLPVMIVAGQLGRTDYSAFYLGGRMTVDHQTQRLYDYRAQLWYQQHLFRAPNPALPYVHLPFEALLFAPLSLLPVRSSVEIWALLNLLLLATVAMMLKPLLGTLGRVPMAALWFGLGFAPIAVALMQGQDTILLLAFVSAAFVEMKRRRDVRAGIFVALALIKWHLVLPIVVVMLLRREWKVIQGFAAGGVVLGAMSLAMTGMAGVPAYLNLVRGIDNSADVVRDMPNLRGLIDPAMGASNAALGVIAAGVLVLFALAVWTGAKRWAQRGTVFDLSFALTVTVALLVSYHTFLHDVTLLLLPLLIAASFYLERKAKIAVVAISCPLLLQVLIQFAGFRTMSLVAIPMLVFAGALAWEIRKLEREPADSPRPETEPALAASK